MSIASKSSIPVILLFGPTGVGKTELIEELFDSRYEIINTDSQQVYRHLDIGTAKAPAQLRNKIKHHLIDIVDPSEGYDVGRFVRDADTVLREIDSRGHVTVLCGGTSFYFLHFLYGLPQVPEVPPDIRGNITLRLRREGRQALRRELEQVDPPSAARIHPHDTQRLLRALEVFHGTGRRISDFPVPTQTRGEYRFLNIGLNRDRTELYRRIDSRVESMWEQGLLAEIKNLLAMGYHEEDPGLRGIGYREFFLMRRAGEFIYPQIREEIKKNSRRYAKRQLSFFRRIPEVRWFHPDQKTEVKNLIDRFLSSRL
ncbi:MAG TPA: tRNA (adenosine(37)-N6)-dimethylallyltransferase MiaA [Sediminispirochaeta sp.]|nr:tRNA (adenosine(37)-N6)-dimethylallyltransferase MiaA [Sediminispirochaeta sp.]